MIWHMPPTRVWRTGEAANRLPEEFKDDHPEVEWHRIRGFRNRILHDYSGNDKDIVWKIKKNFLPDTIEKLLKIHKYKSSLIVDRHTQK